MYVKSNIWVQKKCLTPVCFFLGCGGTLAALEGILQYPHSSSLQYRHNEQCVWTIETTEGHILNITFTSFHLEASSNCYSDYLL
ncbi:unnamed protein product, partial [Allacma fusca]